MIWMMAVPIAPNIHRTRFSCEVPSARLIYREVHEEHTDAETAPPLPGVRSWPYTVARLITPPPRPTKKLTTSVAASGACASRHHPSDVHAVTNSLYPAISWCLVVQACDAHERRHSDTEARAFNLETLAHLAVVATDTLLLTSVVVVELPAEPKRGADCANTCGPRGGMSEELVNAKDGAYK
jgi:hypothetical protein